VHLVKHQKLRSAGKIVTSAQTKDAKLAYRAGNELKAMPKPLKYESE